jgi:hypothetical protein
MSASVTRRLRRHLDASAVNRARKRRIVSRGIFWDHVLTVNEVDALSEWARDREAYAP